MLDSKKLGSLRYTLRKEGHGIFRRSAVSLGGHHLAHSGMDGSCLVGSVCYLSVRSFPSILFCVNFGKYSYNTVCVISNLFCRIFEKYAFGRFDLSAYMKIPGPPNERIFGNARIFANLPIEGIIPKMQGENFCLHGCLL